MSSTNKPREGGRPRLYKSASDLAVRIDAYFAEREGDGKPPTLAGLCYFLGFADKQALSQYEGYGEEFSLPVKKARLRIEQDRSERLLAKDTFTPGVIFDLKNNHGWKDTVEQQHSGSIDGFKVVLERADRGSKTS